MESFLIVIFVAVFLFSIVAIILRHRKEKYKSFVVRHSTALKNMRILNDRYTFHSPINFNKEHTYDNENFYSDVSCEDYLIYQLQYEGKKVDDEIRKMHGNKQKLTLYLKEIDSIGNYGDFDCPIGKLKTDRLMKTERKEFEYLIQKPETELRISIRLNCSNINGRIYESKREIFNEEQIDSLLRRLANRRGNFFNDRGIWDAICRVERGKVSNKMRFSIYKRDGYRCCRCGRNEKTTTLEIDHIIPISKGGKTNYGNLQTLCHRCNVEKGDRLDW